ncbi:hypothetical protein CJ030_MR4G025284 [Morella rubra]|uniref:RNase H type-1 domain-containing protein n=1 Tax=Morella rubra TaxID=262757 RepID=A0A6A1VR06_9ROSI|nr:hypothetical protein CJ030_MR4G025284 [Morella rubra]
MNSMKMIVPHGKWNDLAIYHEVQSSSLCPLCGSQFETLQHLFLECHVSTCIWQASPWYFSTASFAAFPMVYWISVILDPVSIGIPVEDKHYFQLFAANALDLVWQERNRVVRGDASSGLLDLVAHHSCPSNMSLPGPISSYGDPVDGSLLYLGPLSLCVPRSLREDFYAAVKKLCCVDSTMGEAEALWFGVSIADQSSCPVVIFEGDSVVVMTAVDRPFSDCLWRIEPIVALIKSCFAVHPPLKCSFSPRCANFAAQSCPMGCFLPTGGMLPRILWAL